MNAKRRLAHAFTRATGYEVRRAGQSPPPPPSMINKRQAAVRLEDLARARESGGDRLLSRPAFILSSVRSGSTLLRVLVNSHSQLYSPHELHLRHLAVNLKSKYVKHAMEELGADQRELEYLLWDRVLHRDLQRHRKPTLVNKTPNDVFIWQRILECWPDARFIYLFRHPAAMVDSWNRARSYWTREETAADVLRYAERIEEARAVHPGLTLRYEDVTADPEHHLRRLCEYLEVPWEESMLDYGSAKHGEFAPGLGDWSEQIKSGRVQPARTLPADDEIPRPLRETARAWGYLGATAGGAAGAAAEGAAAEGAAAEGAAVAPGQGGHLGDELSVDLGDDQGDGDGETPAAGSSRPDAAARGHR